MNYRLIATEVGDLVKWDSSVNEILRIARALFPFEVEEFPNDAITSVRAQTVYNCVLSLARRNMNHDKRNDLLVGFCRRVVPDQNRDSLEQILRDGLGPSTAALNETQQEFSSRGFHPSVIEHCRILYAQGNYFHAVFEACKVYNKQVQAKAQSKSDGDALMLGVWGCEKGVLKITQCQSETDRNVQDGVKFLSAGLMRAMRNPTAHEPALDWPIDKKDCLDMLSSERILMSFLFRQLDRAVYSKA